MISYDTKHEHHGPRHPDSVNNPSSGASWQPEGAETDHKGQVGN